MKKLTEKLTSKPSFTYYGVFLFFFSVALLTFGIVISRLVTEEKQLSKAAVSSLRWVSSGVEICTATGYQTSGYVISGGANDYIVVWEDERAGNRDIYAQKINSSGVAQWTANGVAICDDSGPQYNLLVVPDGSGGAVITWEDQRSSEWDIYAQRVNSSGIPQWADDGVVVCDETGNQRFPKIIADETGGYIITWDDSRNPADEDIYAQRIDGSGISQWAEDGVVIVSAIDGQFNSTIISDNANGAIISWIDDRGTDWDIYAQRINNSGSVQWAANGVVICDATNEQVNQRYIPDGLGDFLITWDDYRVGPGESNIYAQKINSSGVRQWAPANGVVVCDSSGNQWGPKMVSDGSGGAVIGWREGSFPNDDLAAQRINGSGVTQWASGGVVVCNATNDQGWLTLQIVPSTNDRYLFFWEDQRSGNADFYTQLFDSSGTALWTANGVPIIATSTGEYTGGVFSDSEGGVIATWSDARTGNQNIYAQKLSTWFQIESLASNLDAQDTNDSNIEVGTSGGLGGSSETVRLSDSDNSMIVSEISVNMTDDRDWSTVTGDSDPTTGKSVVTNLTSAPGTGSTHALYVPIPTGEVSNHVVICPNATNLSQVQENCTGAITKNEADADTSKVTISGQVYWKITGLSSSGGFCIITSFIKNLSSSLDVVSSITGESMETGGVGALGTSEQFRLKKTSGNIVISDIIVDMNSHRDWSSISADSEISEGKSVVANLTSAPGTASTHSLYIPIPSGQTSTTVVICPNATTLSQVKENCSGAITKTEFDSDTSKVTISGQTYWKVEGLTSSGGISILPTPPPPPPTTNESPSITIDEPDGTEDLASQSYKITWTDSDPDSNASISLYYDTNDEGNDGTLIVENIDEDDEDDEYDWDVSELAIGFYYVYAQIDDSINDPVVDYSNGPFTKIPPGCEEINSDEDETNDDSDCDGMPDDWEEDNNLDPLDFTDADNDPDADDLTNLEEYQNDTNPHDADTDGDSIPDGWEVEHGLDPTDPSDATANPDGDGCTNYEEYINDTDPFTPDCNLVLPETGEEETRSKISQFVTDLGNFVGDQIKKLRENEAVVTTTKVVATPLATIPVSGQIIAVVLSTSSALFVSPTVLLPALLALIKRERKNHWGIVHDQKTKEPIPFAVVRLKGKGKVITKVSDLQGRYNLIMVPGTYTLTINHPEYKDFSSEVTVKKDRSLSIDSNIGLEPKKIVPLLQLVITIRNFTTDLFDQLGYFLLIGGFLLSIFVWTIVPTLLSSIIVLVYLPILFIYHRSKTQYPANWGRVMDSVADSPVKGAFVKIFREAPEGSRLLDTAITNIEGRYGFLLDEAGEYLILVAATGYKFPSKDSTLPTHFHESLVKVILDKSKVFKDDLLVDPGEKKIKPTSPFSGE